MSADSAILDPVEAEVEVEVEKEARRAVDVAGTMARTVLIGGVTKANPTAMFALVPSLEVLRHLRLRLREVGSVAARRALALSCQEMRMGTVLVAASTGWRQTWACLNVTRAASVSSSVHIHHSYEAFISFANLDSTIVFVLPQSVMMSTQESVVNVVLVGADTTIPPTLTQQTSVVVPRTWFSPFDLSRESREELCDNGPMLEKKVSTSGILVATIEGKKHCLSEIVIEKIK